jgi:hypothetical protein
MFSKTQTDRDSAPRRRMSYANVMSTISVFMVLAGGTALAAQLPANSVNSKTVKDNKLKSVDLKDGAAVSGADVVDASLTGGDIANGSVNTVDIADGAINSAKVPNDALNGADIDETTLGQVSDAASLQGRGPASFLSSSVYKNESAVTAGQTLGDGTHVLSATCNPGDVLLSGGPANINAATTLLESFPSPGSTNSWSARVNKNGGTDNFSVVVLCIDQ